MAVLDHHRFGCIWEHSVQNEFALMNKACLVRRLIQELQTKIQFSILRISFLLIPSPRGSAMLHQEKRQRIFMKSLLMLNQSVSSSASSWRGINASVRHCLLPAKVTELSALPDSLIIYKGAIAFLLMA